MGGRVLGTKWGTAIAVLLALGIGKLAFAQSSQPVIERVCRPDGGLVTLPPIPVGCAAVDCCPGCPGPDIIDWRIRVKGEGVQSIQLQTKQVPRASRIAKKLPAALRNGSMRLSARGGVIRGLPSSKAGPLMSLQPVVQLDKSADRVDLVFEQLLAGKVVNAQTMAIVQGCEPEDVIELKGNDDGDASVVMIDGNGGASCLDNRIFQGKAEVKVGRLIENGPCRSQVAVASARNRFALLPDVQAWTSGADRLPVQLEPPLIIPVTIWLGNHDAESYAHSDIATAQKLFTLNKIGVVFDVQLGFPDRAALNTRFPWCARNMPSITSTADYHPGRINVYYTDFPQTARYCSDENQKDKNVIYVGKTSSSDALTWGLGRAFGLAHFINPTTPTHEYIMDSGARADGTEPPIFHTRFSLGEIYRMHVTPTSLLREKGGYPAVWCREDNCPPITLDWR